VIHLAKGDDRSSGVTAGSFIPTLCKLRAGLALRITVYCLCPVFRGALETASLPTASAKPPVSWPERPFWSIRQNALS